MKVCRFFAARERSRTKCLRKTAFAGALRKTSVLGGTLLGACTLLNGFAVGQETGSQARSKVTFATMQIGQNASVVSAEANSKSKRIRLSDGLDSPAEIAKFSGSLTELGELNTSHPEAGSLTNAIGVAKPRSSAIQNPVPSTSAPERIPELGRRDQPMRLTDRSVAPLPVQAPIKVIPSVELRPTRPVTIHMDSVSAKGTVSTPSGFAITDGATAATVVGQGVDLASLANSRPIRQVVVKPASAAPQNIASSARAPQSVAVRMEMQSLPEKSDASRLASQDIQIVKRGKPFRLSDSSSPQIRTITSTPSLDSESLTLTDLPQATDREALANNEAEVSGTPGLAEALPTQVQPQVSASVAAPTSLQPIATKPKSLDVPVAVAEDIANQGFSNRPISLAETRAPGPESAMVALPPEPSNLKPAVPATLPEPVPAPSLPEATHVVTSTAPSSPTASTTALASSVQPKQMLLEETSKPLIPEVEETTETVRKDLPIREGKLVSLRPEATTTIECKTTLSEYSIEHPKTCRVVKTSDNKLTLIALQPGKTRVAFVTTNSEGESFIELRQVEVQATSLPKDSRAAIAEELTATISQMYETKTVSVIAKNDEFIVSGTAATEKDARKILSLVRKTTLCPVVDKLKAHYK